MNGDLMHFLLPSWGSALELTFFVLIIGSLLVSLISAEISGRQATWERNWKGGAHKGALDLEHGSISELSHALASLPERIVGHMPGLLLIFGLLGTFLGLGMALDKASGVLQGSGDSINAMSDSLGQLTGMMKDLGSKFKTSTWGIIAFITLKLWEASRWSADSRRTDWCVRQMKWEMDLLRRRQREHSDARDQKSHEVLEAVGERLLQGSIEQKLLLGEIKRLKELDLPHARRQQTQLIEALQLLGKGVSQGNRVLTSLDQHAAANGTRLDALQQSQHEQTTQAQARHVVLTGQFDTLVSLAGEGNRTLAGHATTSSSQLEALATLHGSAIEQSQERHAVLIGQLAEIASQTQESNLTLATLDKHAESSASQRADLLDKSVLISERLATLHATCASHEEQLKAVAGHVAMANESLQEVGRHTQASMNSFERFEKANDSNLVALKQAGETMSQAGESMGQAGETMGLAAQRLGGSAEALQGTVKLMEENLGGAIGTLNEDFARHLATMQHSLDSNISQLGVVLNQLQDSLTRNIESMNADFASNTQAMAGDLRQATDNIATAVNQLANQVGDVMAKVSTTIDAANAIQGKTAASFSATSDELNEVIGQMTQNMESLGKNIVQRMQDVSETGQQFRHTVKSMKDFTTLAQQLGDSLGQLRVQNEQTGKTLDSLPERLGNELRHNGKLLEQLRADLAPLQALLVTTQALPQALGAQVNAYLTAHLQPLQAPASSGSKELARPAKALSKPAGALAADNPVGASTP